MDSSDQDGCSACSPIATPPVWALHRKKCLTCTWGSRGCIKAPCNLVDGYGCLGETYWFHLQGRTRDSRSHQNIGIHVPNTWRMLSHSKRLNQEWIVRHIRFQKAIVLTLTAARNSKPHTRYWTCMEATLAGFPRIHSSTLKKKVVNGAEMLVTTCEIRRFHISEDRHLNARFVLHWLTEPLGLAFYPTWKQGGQHEESKQSAAAPYLESCHASHRLNCEQRKQAGYLIR
jgi:hypothetical protein